MTSCIAGQIEQGFLLKSVQQSHSISSQSIRIFISKEHRLDGIDPCNELSFNSSNTKLVSAPTDEGIVPVNEFEYKPNVDKFVNKPIDDGIDPVN